MKILAIDTSADETAAAVVEGRRIVSNVIYSQINIHKKWGGIYPTLAKRAHEERIDGVVEKAIKGVKSYELGVRREDRGYVGVKGENKMQVKGYKLRVRGGMDNIDAIAVTQGPGLAIALEVGIQKAKALATEFKKPLIAVNHLEGHLYSCFAQNSVGNPDYEIKFPYLGLIISGGHTQIVLIREHLQYQILGEILDDAAGEALDKAAKLLGLGYPGGPVIEQLAHEVGQIDKYHFPRPMLQSKNLDFSFSGLKTSFYYYVRELPEKEKIKITKYLVSSFQEAVFDVIVRKTESAIKQSGVSNIIVGGGVCANLYLRKLLRKMVKKNHGTIIFPPFKYLTGDNAAMIGVVAGYKAEKKMFIQQNKCLDRISRMTL